MLSTATALSFLLLLVAAQAEPGRRALLARSVSKSASIAQDGGVAQSVSSAVARGDVTAVADVIASANQGGNARAVAEALADEARQDPAKRNAIAKAIAEATDLSEEDANRALDSGDVTNLAEAIAVSSGGKTTAKAISLSEAISESQPAIASAIVNAYSTVSGGGEAIAAATANVQAIGTAIAKAFASAEIELSVEGDGYASAVSEANAEALSRAFSEVLVEGFAKAANDFGAATASFKEQQIAEVIASASAEAFVAGSQTGEGKTAGFQSSVAEAVSEVLVQVVAEALTAAFGEGNVDSYVYVEPTITTTTEATTATESGSTTSKGGEAVTEGEADAVALAVCSGSIRLCCTTIKVRGTTCSTLCSGVGECSFSRDHAENGITIDWKNDATGEICTCAS